MAISLYEGLRGCSRTDYAEAGKEALFTLLFSFLPILIGILFGAMSTRVGAVADVVNNFLSGTNALLLAAAIVGPLLYALNKKYGNLPRSLKFDFPSGWFYLILIVIVCLVASTIFGYEAALPCHYPVNDAGCLYYSLSRRSVFAVSCVALCVSVFVLFTISALKNYLEHAAPSLLSNDTEKFVKEFTNE